MRMRWRVAIGGIAIAGLVTVFVLSRPAGRGQDMPAAGHDASGAPATGTASTPQTTRWEGEIDLQRTQLEAAAADGDPHAAFRLGQALAHCLQYRPLADAQVTQMTAELIAQAGSSLRIGGRPIGDDRSIDIILFAHREGRRLCAGTTSLRETPPTLSAYDYIAQAAQAGHPGAMALYSDLAFRDYRTPFDLIENAEEVERRRMRAHAYLVDAVRLGDAGALHATSRAYDTDGWFARDPERALAYWLAYAATEESRRIPDSIAAERTAELEGRASAAQRERAVAQAARIAQNFRERTDAH